MSGAKGIAAVLRAMLGLVAALALHAAPAAARSISAGEACMAGAELVEDLRAVAADGRRWHCSKGNWRNQQPTTFIRFAARAGSGEPMRSFVTRASRFSAIELTAVDRDGTQRSRRYGMDDVRAVTGGPWIVLALPEVRGETAEIVARIDEPWLTNAVSDARVSSSADGSATSLPRLMFYAALCGLLLAPLLLNLAFWRVLRERFILWHFAMVLAMLSQVMVTTGLINTIATPPLWFTAFYSFFVYSVILATGLVFTASFIEPDCMSVRLRRTLTNSAPLVPFMGLAFCLPIPALRDHGSMLYHLSLLPPLALIGYALHHAWRRGSRMVRFQVIGWIPPILAGLYRIGNYLLSNGTPDDALLAYNASLGVEVVATTLGTVSRLLALRRERDLAHMRAEQLETVAGSDPLTGLANRLELERRFTSLYLLGFRTMAVIDLDHFKQINDSHGHGRGDEVLCAAAEALAPDDDCHVVRLGGEEFLLLLRGEDAAQRAERRRQAIPTRVAARVPGLGQLVTASMGLVERHRAASLRAEFREIYDHCDRLLYEAKRTGRNRTMRERVVSFDESPPSLQMAL